MMILAQNFHLNQIHKGSLIWLGINVDLFLPVYLFEVNRLRVGTISFVCSHHHAYGIIFSIVKIQ